jgi:integrase
MEVTFTTIFNRKSQLNQNGKAPIEIRIYQNRKRKFIGTGILIAPDEWDPKKQLVNKKHSMADELNERIKEKLRDLENLRLKHKVGGKNFSINSVSTEPDSNPSNSFLIFIKAEIEKDQTLSSKTKISHHNLINKLKEFKKNKDIFFADIDYTFVDDFMNFLRKQNYAINTVHKHHKNLKKYIELGIKKGFYDQKNPCKELRVRTEQKKRGILTWEEIKSIEELDLNNYESKISLVRDIFLFSFYTGLRISDATNLQTEYVKKDKEGYRLDFVTIKANKRAEIPLHILFKPAKSKLSKPEIILEKYFDKKNEFVFPRLSEPYINRQLKLLASLTEIPEKVTFHTARHSFGTYMAGKIPIPQLMFLMQHSDIKTTMIYVNINRELVKQGLLKIDWE